MSRCQRSSQWRNSIGEPCLVKWNHIHISFTQKEIWLLGTSCPVQSIQIPALIKNHCFRWIQIFWFCISHHTTTKSDYPAIDIHNRKHHTVPELIIHTIPFINTDQSCFGNHVILISFRLQVTVQIITVLIRITQTKCLDRLVTELSFLKISKSYGSLTALKLHVIILCCSFVDFQKNCPCIRTFFCLFRVFFLRKFYPCSVCQIFQCLDKCIILILHQKCKYISSGTASKTIIHLLLPADRKRRRLFIVKRTQAKIWAAFFLQFYISRYYIYNIISWSYFFDNLIRIIHFESPHYYYSTKLFDFL